MALEMVSWLVMSCFGIKPIIFHMISKCCTTEWHLQPKISNVTGMLWHALAQGQERVTSQFTLLNRQSDINHVFFLSGRAGCSQATAQPGDPSAPQPETLMLLFPSISLPDFLKVNPTGILWGTGGTDVPRSGALGWHSDWYKRDQERKMPEN